MSNSSAYVVWPNANQTPYSCVLGKMKGMDAKQLFPVHQGQPQLPGFPAVEFSFDPDFPDNTILSDNLLNQHQLIVVSDRLRSFLEARAIPAVEYLKVTVKDHKGKTTVPYFIVHTLQPVDCLDRQASGAIVRPTMKDQIMAVKKTVLIPQAIPPDRTLFRLSGFSRICLVRRDLAEAIEKAFDGIKFREPEEVR